MSENEVTELEKVEEIYQLLTEHELPEGYRISCLPPKMTGEEAFSVIWFLQERPRVLPDHIERCDSCSALVDSWSEHVDYVQTLEKRLCSSCYDFEEAYECCLCEEHDCHEKPGRLAVFAEEVDGLKSGLYRITGWPMYANGMIECHLYTNKFEKVGELPEGADTNGFPIGFLCRECEVKLKK